MSLKEVAAFLSESISDQNDLHILAAIIEYHGGTASVNPDEKYSHHITTIVDEQVPDGVVVVTPSWIEDCHTLERKLPVSEYHPSLMRRQQTTHELANSNIFQEGSPEQDMSSYKFYFDQPVVIPQLEAEATRRGAKLLKTIKDDCYVITQYSGSEVYRNAKKQQVRSLFYVAHLLAGGNESDGDMLIFQPFHRQQPSGEVPVVCLSNYVGKSREALKFMITEVLGWNYSSSLEHNTTTMLVSSNAQGKKYEAAMKWGLLVVNHLYVEDAILQKRMPTPTQQKYLVVNSDAKTMNRVVGMVKVPADYHHQAAISLPTKRKSSTVTLNENEVFNKRHRTLQPGIRILFTGIDKRPDGLADLLKKLNVTEVTKVEDATHLVSTRVARTEKFMRAIACCQWIVNLDWLSDSATKGRLLPETDYLLHDPACEKEFGFDLQAAVRKSKKQPFLQGYAFYQTQGIVPPALVMGRIIKDHGGELKDTYQDGCIVLSTPQDYEPRFGIAYTAELILLGVLTQKLDLSSTFQL